MAGGSDTISTNGTTFTVGDTLTITFSFYSELTCSGTLHIGNTTYDYSNCSNPKTGEVAKDSNPFSFTLTEVGTYTVYYVNHNFEKTSNVITITVESDAPSTPTVSWTINNKTVNGLYINNKEVQSIVRNSDGKVLYEKASAHNYSLAFNQASYQTDSNGQAILSLTLLDNNVAVSGATISITGSDGSVYSCITNQLGVGSVTVNYQSNVTITASYDNINANTTIISNYSFDGLEIKIINTNTFSSYSAPFSYTGDVSIDWGDGTIQSYTSGKLSHNYSVTGNYTIRISGEISEIKNTSFNGNKVISEISFPSTLTRIGSMTFMNNTKLTKVIIPSNVTSITNSFRLCSSLVDYQLYWDNPPVTWSSNLMPNNTNTIFTIPNGTTANYVAKSFPSGKLVERSG